MEKGILLILLLLVAILTIYFASFAGSAIRQSVRQQENLTRFDTPAEDTNQTVRFWTPPISLTPYNRY